MDKETEQGIRLMVEDFQEFLIGLWKNYETKLENIEISVTWDWKMVGHFRGFTNDISYILDKDSVYFKNQTTGEEKVIEMEEEATSPPSTEDAGFPKSPSPKSDTLPTLKGGASKGDDKT